MESHQDPNYARLRKENTSQLTTLANSNVYKSDEVIPLVETTIRLNNTKAKNALLRIALNCRQNPKYVEDRNLWTAYLTINHALHSLDAKPEIEQLNKLEKELMLHRLQDGLYGSGNQQVLSMVRPEAIYGAVKRKAEKREELTPTEKRVLSDGGNVGSVYLEIYEKESERGDHISGKTVLIIEQLGLAVQAKQRADKPLSLEETLLTILNMDANNPADQMEALTLVAVAQAKLGINPFSQDSSLKPKLDEIAKAMGNQFPQIYSNLLMAFK